MGTEEPSLLDLARQRGPGQRGVCSVSTVLANHPRAAEVRELLDALASRQVQYSAAHEVLKAADIPLTADTLSRHTRRKCSCPS